MQVQVGTGPGTGTVDADDHWGFEARSQIAKRMRSIAKRYYNTLKNLPSSDRVYNPLGGVDWRLTRSGVFNP